MGGVPSCLAPPSVAVLPDFPESLGPFAVVPTPLEGKDFRIQPRKIGEPCKFPLMSEDHGTTWMMDKEPLARCGADIRGRHRVQGQFSPRHQITLRGSVGQCLNIPANARTFVFSYPVQEWNELGQATATPAGSFLNIGGFVYLDAQYNILGANTLMAYTGGPGALVFSPPRPWSSEWTKELMEYNRLQPVTIQGMRAAGARRFCWLRPQEFFPRLRSQPDVPHGGFVYLFSEDEPTSEDCYFAVAHSGRGDVAVGCFSADQPFEIVGQEKVDVRSAAAG